MTVPIDAKNGAKNLNSFITLNLMGLVQAEHIYRWPTIPLCAHLFF
jgi:hypothetical protein